MRTSTHLAWITIAAFAGGCTAAKANLQLVTAEQALVRAESEGAPQRAEYEYTMARRYLEKAREEAGYSEYRVADALARKSAEWSDRAIIFVERRGRTEFDLDDLSVVPDMAPPTAPPPPPPDDDVPPPAPGQPSDDDLFSPTSIDVPVPGEDPPPADEPEADEPEADEPAEDDFEMDDDIDIGVDP